MMRKQWAARELEIGENSTDEEAHTAYRDLIAVWHPDQHASNDRIRKKAEEKTKRLVLAYGVFTGMDTSSPVPCDTTEELRHGASFNSPGPVATASREQTAPDAYQAPHKRPPATSRPTQSGSTFEDVLPWALIAIVIAILLALQVAYPKGRANPPSGAPSSKLLDRIDPNPRLANAVILVGHQRPPFAA